MTTNERPYCTNLILNLKGGRRTVTLGKRTVIVGPNGAGKSAIGQGLTLIHGGFADGIDGRDEVKDGRLISLVAPGQALFVEGHFSNGSNASATMKEGGGKLALSSGKANDNATMAHAVRRALKGSGETARQAFLGWATNDLTDEAVLRLIPSDLVNLFKPAFTGGSGTPVERLVSVKDWAKKQAKTASDKVKGAEAILENMELPNLPVSQEDVDAALADYEALRDGHEGWRKRQEYEAAVKEVARLTELLRINADSMAKATGDLLLFTAKQTNVRFSQNTAKELIEAETHNCPVCERQSDEPVTWREALQAELDIAEQGAPLRAEVERLERVRSNIQRESALAQATVERLTPYANSPATNSETIQAALDNYTNLLADVRAWKAFDDNNNVVRTMKKEAERYKTLASTLDDTIALLLKQRVGKLTAAWNKELAGWEVTLSLDPFNWTVDKKDGKHHSALSGSEFETVVMGLASALLKMVKYDGPSLVIAADRGWSVGGLEAAMKGLAGSDCQIIIESTVAPSVDVEGWSILFVEGNVQPDANVQSEAEVKVKAKEELPANYVTYLKRLGYNEVDMAGMDKEEAAVIMRAGKRKE